MTINDKLRLDHCCEKSRKRQFHRHHIDPTLKTRDPSRYKKFLESDIMICTPNQHRHLHKIYNTYSYDEYLLELYALSATNLEVYNECWSGTAMQP